MTDPLFRLNLPDPKKLSELSAGKNSQDVKRAIAAEKIGLEEMLSLLSPAAAEHIEAIAGKSREITLKRFGKTIHLYAPIYLSSYCINSCLYCGFRKESNISRKIQPPELVEKEARILREMGFKNILLVAGDDPQVTTDYLVEIIHRLRSTISSISLEVAPKSVDEYKKICRAGAEGVVIYQETYHQKAYERYHPSGTKSDYNFRLSTPGRVATAGFHRVGMGVLLGLNDFLYEGLALFEHVNFILKNYWKTEVTISLPRIRKANQAIEAPFPVSDKEFTQLICSLRIAFPDVGILLSTREEPFLRDGLMKIGVTHISAGSRTEVGGYLLPDQQNEQFNVEDKRSPAEVQNRIREIGYEPVWKDWEAALND